MKNNSFSILKIISAVIFIGLFLYYGDHARKMFSDPGSLREIIIGYGLIAPLVYMLIYILSCLFFLPGSLLTLTGGAIFGLGFGIIYTIIGATLGALLAFFWSRFMLRSALGGFIRRQLPVLSSYDEKLEKHGFVTVLIFRLIPLFPFNGLNFALGLTRVKWKDYTLATLLGIIPGTAAYVYLGDSLAMMKANGILISLIFILILMLSRWYYERKKTR